MEPCYKTGSLVSQKQFHKPNTITDSTTFDVECRYYNTVHGFYPGEYCHYEYISKSSLQTSHQMLIQHQIKTHNSLQNVSSQLMAIFNKSSTKQAKNASITADVVTQKPETKSPTAYSSPKLKVRLTSTNFYN